MSDRLSTRELMPQRSAPFDAYAHPHPSQQRAPKLTLSGVSVRPERPHPRPHTAATAAVDLLSSANSSLPASPSRGGSRSLSASSSRSSLAHSPVRSYESQAARHAAMARGSPLPRSPHPNSAAPPPPMVGRSPEERFDRWKANLHEYIEGASSPGSPLRRRLEEAQREEQEQHASQPDAAAPEEKADASIVPPPPIRRRRPAHAQRPPASGSSSAQGSVRSSPSASPARHASHAPSHHAAAAPAPNGVAHSLTTLHRKVRSGSAHQLHGSAQHLRRDSDPRVFDRLSHGLAAHDRAQVAASNGSDPRSSLESIEAAFIAKMQTWAPAPAAAVPDPAAASAAPPSLKSRPPSASPPAGSAASKLRGGVSAVSERGDSASSVAREEEQLRLRAQSLAADVAALQHRQRVAFLAEQAAQLRIQARLQLEEQEAMMRTQLESKLSAYRDTKDASVHSCLQLQRDLHAKMAMLAEMDQQLTQRILHVENGYQAALHELQTEYNASMDSLHATAAAQMEQQLQQLAAHTNSKQRTADAATVAAPQVDPAPSLNPWS